MKIARDRPWKFLDDYRGTIFSGEWPTLPELFVLTSHRYADRACFTVFEPERRSLSYREALAKIEGAARKLRSLGIGRGDKVAVTGKNSPEWAVAYFAVLTAGAVVVPLDYQLTVTELANLVKAGDVVALFVDEEKEAELTAASPALKAVFSIAAGRPGNVLDLDAPEAPAFDKPAEGDLAAILFTSGTMGSPKGVMLTHRNLVADAYLSQANLPIFHSDVFYALLPIHHAYTMLAVFIEAVSVGAEIVFAKRLVIKQVLKDLKEAKVTMFLGVPLLFNKLLAGIMRGVKDKGSVVYGLIFALMGVSFLIKRLTGKNPGKRIFHSILDKAGLASIRICISGGGPLAPKVFRRYNELGIDFVQGYGLTETSPILTLNPTDAFIVTSVGKLVAGVEMKILEPDSEGVGEIAVRGPMVMSGYYKMPAETAEVLSPDGWLKTGDLGYKDGQDYVYLEGRAKNMIVTEGGKNVYPEEIENRFQLFDEVEQVLVCGYIEDEEMKSEGIEAMLFPNAERFKAGTEGLAALDWGSAEARLREIVEAVNQKLLPYQKISKVTVLRERLAETTKKTVKRFAVAKN
ncbi:MAG: AMP-binding protein [Rectinemataceae bacterium]|jgi:long-chain acyl-CoA synthetase